MRDLMIDIETLGNRPGSIILSIGAMIFNAETGETGEEFYVAIDAETAASAGLTSDVSTMIWWLKQSKEASDAAFTGDRPIEMALADFADFVCKHEPSRVWAKPPSFDLVLIEAAFRACDVSIPWHFSTHRDCRTIFDLTSSKPKIAGTAHNALDDARAQALAVIEAYRVLGLSIPSTQEQQMGGGDELSLTKSGLAIAMTKITAYEAALARFRTERKYIVGCNDGFMEAIEQAARIADEVFASMIDKRDECLSEGPPNCHGALTRARQAQTAEEIGKAIRALSASPAPKDRPSGVVEVCPICDIAGCKHLRAAHEPDWKDDPSSDKRWMAGLDYCMAQLCDYLSVNPSSVMWDAATETLDGDVQSVIGNILRKHFGADWGPTPAPKSEGE